MGTFERLLTTMNQFVPFQVAGHSTAGCQGVAVNNGGCFVKKKCWHRLRGEGTNHVAIFNPNYSVFATRKSKSMTYCSGGSLTAAKFILIYLFYKKKGMLSHDESYIIVSRISKTLQITSFNYTHMPSLDVYLYKKCMFSCFHTCSFTCCSF